MKKLLLMLLVLSMIVTMSLVSCTLKKENENEHEHDFTERSLDIEYLKSNATCESPALYYYSCECGEKGEETFANGSALKHKYVNGFCRNCNAEDPDNTEDPGTGNNPDPDPDPEIPHTHIYNNWVNVQPTCVDSGYSGYACSCGEYNIIETYEPTGVHSYENGYCVNCNESMGLEFELNPDGASYALKSIGTYTGEELNVPFTYNSLPVTAIAEYAFYECSTLKSISIHNGITTLGNYALAKCENLTTVEIDSGVSYLSGKCFFGSANIERVTINHYNEHYKDYNGVVYTADETELVFFPPNYSDTEFKFPSHYSVTKIGEYAFAYADSLESIELPYGLTTIDVAAFYKCSALTSVLIPYTVTRIEDGAFSSCTSLESVTLFENLEFIGTLAFSDCTSLTEIVIPRSVTCVGPFAFDSCASLTINCVCESLPASWSTLWNDNGLPTVWGYGSSGLSFSLNADGLSLTVTSIDDCDDVFVVIPATYVGFPVTAIADNAFYSNTSMVGVSIPDSVTAIGSNAFEFCTSLKSIILPNSITYIDEFAFYGCEKLAYVTLPDNLLYLMRGVFAYCEALQSITLPESIISINYGAFACCYELENINIPKNVTFIAYVAFGHCYDLADIAVDPDNTNYTSIDGSLYSKDGKILIKYATGRFEESFTIPSHVTTIADYAFGYNHSLKTVIIPNSVTSIGNGAFASTRCLVSIVIPASVTEIGEYAFSDINEDFLIYCVAASQPSGWNTLWNTGDYSVVWGYSAGSTLNVSIPAALLLPDNTPITVSGTVKTVTPYNFSYGNMSVTIVDADGNELFVYRLAEYVDLGDIITVTGVIGTYEGKRQILEGATADLIGYDPSYAIINQYTVAELWELPDYTNVKVLAIVVSVDTPYNATHNNISVTVADAEGLSIYVYRLEGYVEVGDIIFITGYLNTYEGNKQIASGATFELINSDDSFDTYVPHTIPEALAAEQGTYVAVRGTVRFISRWVGTYSNMNAIIVDENGNEIFVYRLGTYVELGDTVVIYGQIGTYNGVNSIDEGGFAFINGNDPAYAEIPEYTVGQLLDVPDNTNVAVKGTVISIETEYSYEHDNISIYLADSAGNVIYVYRLEGCVEVGDEITVVGYVTTYNGERQIGSGAEFYY